jgi:hypothetical protein
MSSDLASRSEGLFGRAAGSRLRNGHHEGSHTRTMGALMAAEECRPGRNAWTGRSGTKEAAAMAFVEGTYPSEIRRKRMSRKESSLSTSLERLGTDRVECDHESSQRKSQREWMGLATLSFVCISYSGV